MEGDSRADGSFAVELELHGRAEVREVGGTIYLRADASFWTDNGGREVANVIAGKWVKGSADQFGGERFQLYEPQNFAYCMTRNWGTLSDGGTARVDGTPVRIIKSAADQPGASESELSIATEGEPFPVRVVQKGPDRPGAPKDARCGDDDEDDDDPFSADRGELTLSDFGADSAIEAPADAIDLSQLAASRA